MGVSCVDEARRFWGLKVGALAEGRFWDVLFAFANEKKSPIGYVPFVEVCLKYDNGEEAIRYLPKVGMKDENER